MFKEIEPKELKARLDAGEAIQIIDVREGWELGLAHLDNVMHIPMNSIPDSLDQIPKETPVVIMCHHGSRSAQVVYWLQAQGWNNLLNLDGGIHRWSQEIDSKVPMY